MFVIKHPINAEVSWLLCSLCHFAATLDAQFLPALIGREKKDLNSNVRPRRRALAAEDQGPV